MCGIAGCMGDITDQELKNMAQAILHRGPDNISFFSEGNIHLSHVRLSIIDLTESSNQPLWDSSKQACITFNGEIYNYKELKESLINKGYSFNSKGDSEVLLNMYLEYGVELFDKINGIFALAIWDTRLNELLVARDHYGVKPLYYTENDKSFYFSSEMKSFFEVDSIDKNLNYEAILRTLVFLWSPGPDTVVEGVSKLEPGCYLRVKDNHILEKKFFWSYPQSSSVLTNVEQAANLIQESLSQSVKDQMVADVPIGSFLSGGLDSSLIVSLAKQSTSKKFRCFTIDSINNGDDGFADDLPYAIEIAKKLDLPLEIVEANPSIIKQLPYMIFHLDEPQADPAPLNVSLICQKAKEMGVKVLLSGAGGDDLFSGYRRHKAILMEKYWSWLPKPFRKILEVISSKLPKSNIYFSRIAKLFQYASLSSDERLLSYFYWMDPKLAMDLFSDDVKNNLSKTPMSTFFNELNNSGEIDPVERMLFLEKRYFLVDHNFNYTDKMSMAHGVEVRVPFLDRRVIDVASRIPPHLKQTKVHGKWILKKAAERLLPKSVIYRSKTGFGAPLRAWLKSDLKPLVDNLLSEESLTKRGLFNAKKINELIRIDREKKGDYAYPIFALLCIEIWCRLFLDEEKIEL